MNIPVAQHLGLFGFSVLLILCLSNYLFSSIAPIENTSVGNQILWFFVVISSTICALSGALHFLLSHFLNPI